MVRIEFLGPIKKEALNLDITNLNQLSDILKQDEDLTPWLQNSAIAVNDILVKDKNINLKNGDKVSLLPPVCGG
jgi:molybdopterin synthase sulfur carrier subunit